MAHQARHDVDWGAGFEQFRRYAVPEAMNPDMDSLRDLGAELSLRNRIRSRTGAPGETMFRQQSCAKFPVLFVKNGSIQHKQTNSAVDHNLESDRR